MARRARIDIRMNPQAVQAMLRSPSGPVAREIDRRGQRVLTRAKELVGVDTGRLRASLTIQSAMTADGPTAVVGTRVDYARYHHDGTGVYGPTGQRIRPRRAKALRFKPKGSSVFIFRASVKGSRPNPFLRDALEAARDNGGVGGWARRLFRR